MAANTLVSFVVIIFFLTFNVDGDEEAQLFRCPGLGEKCNPAFVNPCCAKDLECRKIHSTGFVCSKKASPKINLPAQPNNTTRSSILGGPCRISEHCKPENSVCIYNACQCNSLFTSVSDSTCVRKVLGYPCIDGLCEKIPYAKCSDNICKCTLNSVAINSIRCQPTINRTCISDFSCTVENSHCIDQKCQCKPQYAPTASEQCLPTKLGQYCSEDEECLLIRNAKCYEKKCVCKGNYVKIRNNVCMPLLNGFCSKNYPCIAENFYCIDHECQCKPNFRRISLTKCISVFETKTCLTDEHCAELQNSACVEKRCECKANYVRTNQTRCDPLLDQPCRKSKECATPNSICIDKVCQCALFYSQRGINSCLPGTLKGLCGRDEDCKEILNSNCVENKCQCRDGFVEKNVFSCVKSLGELCTRDRDCFDNTTLCIDNRCQCGYNHMPLFEGQCRSVYVNKVCHDDHDCEENSFCSNNGVCVCDYNYAPLNGVCAPLLNVSCSPNEDCAVENAFCIDGKCQCSLGYAPRSNYQCKISHLGKNCKNDIDCSFIKNAKCSDQVCQCRKNYAQLSPTICRALNGEPCSADGDCAVTNAACIDNECHCNHKFVTTRDYCEPPPSRQVCIDDSDCTEFNTKCSSIGECVCKPNHPEINDVECGSWLADSCLVDQDCLVEDSVCIDDKCQCKSQYVAESKFKCVPLILGRQCRDDVDCSAISNALCSDKKICACAGDSFAIGKLTCVPSVGKICSSKRDCVSPTSYCINNKCQCIRNFVTVSKWQCVASNSTFSCENDYDCGEPWHSECSMFKKCVCKLNSYATNMSTCRPLLRGYCWKDNQCLPENSECKNFQCKCKNRFVAAANNLCVPL